MSKDSIGGMLETTIGKIKDVLGSESIIGQPINLPNGAVAIPVSRLSFGFGSGGANLKASDDSFGGGLGGGVTVVPVAFLLVSAEGNAKLLQISENASAVENVINQAPDMVNKIVEAFGKKPEEKASLDADAEEIE